MKPAFQFASWCAMAVLLAACGGSSTDSTLTASRTAMGARVAQAAHAPAEYNQAVQSIYIGFFGRPADAKGLDFWSRIFSDQNLPLTLPELIAGYSTNAQISNTLNAFVASPEFAALYVHNNASFVNAVYLNAFNRNAELSGLQFWSGFLDRKEIAPAQAVLWIVSGGVGDDATVASKKIQSAALFTSLLDTTEKINAYEPQVNSQAARNFFSTITAATDMTAFRTQIDQLIAAMLGQQPMPAMARYAGYHYLQDLSTNAPLYPANYTYASGGVVAPATSGTLTYGTPAQTIKYVRSGGAYTYDAPVVASASFGGGVIPAVNMLCQKVVTSSGDVVKSTDLLVTRAAVQLLTAADLAGQTLSVYRENCATGGSNLSSMSFDAQGNGTFPLASGTMTINADGVTQLLNGQTQPDLSTGKLLGFAAYRYLRNDGSAAYVIVQHLGNHKVGLTDGILATWSQE